MSDQFTENNRYKIALMIDGDNARPNLINKILLEAGKYGAVTIRRIFGDWTTANMNGWKEELNNHAIQPIQQFRYTIGKNATDSAMIIDSMDVLHSGLVNCFCIVSSDSDYTRLATRIREAGMFVIGIGEKKTPKSFVNACNVFIYNENILEHEISNKKSKATKKEANIKNEEILNPIPLLKEAFQMAVQEDGWAHLSTLGIYLHQLDPGFDPRTYGFTQLVKLIKSYNNVFELKFQDNSGPTAVYVKLKE